MIKGVNKKVLEVNNPQSIYFEKAVLYIRPNLSGVSYKTLCREARELLQSMSPKPPKYAVMRRVALIAAFFASALCGAAVFWVFTR